MRVKCLAQEHNTMTWPGLELGPLAPESSALTTRPSLYISTSEQIGQADKMLAGGGGGWCLIFWPKSEKHYEKHYEQ